ncbi:sensor histidine kinase [Dictyobacter aurantiacus]|uniref:sensor histidine kinase n=1 Tax=Dictyobacter aurantiacus TaxID=1936993 RepID=UPI00135AA1CB|nr:HAMP domain-containing sensor histidine kinase [Dictyobacter aurantiacus]
MLDPRIFHTMTASIRQLVGCEDVGLFLYCPDATLCHPFLMQAGGHLACRTHCYGSIHALRPLIEERVRAICDIAIQTKSIWKLVMPLERREDREPCSMLIAPLWRPSGNVGLVVCTASYEDAFGPGEGQLLSQFLPRVAARIEHVLRQLSCGQPNATDASAAVSTSPLELDRGEGKIPEQDALLSMIGHDFRTPLSVIKGYVGLLQTYGFAGQDEEVVDAMPLESQRRYLLSVMEQVQHLEVLVDDLLDLARIQSGRITVRPEPLDLVALCQRVARQMQDRVALQETSSYTIQCLADAELPSAWADEHRVRQVLENLLENAIKYSPEGGLIEILIYTTHTLPLTNYVLLKDHSLVTEEQLPQLCITVRDYGIGIPAWQQSMVFEPFLRLPQVMARHVNGVGLGLYIVRRLVEAMDGTIALQSGNGRGTAITLTLPAASTSASLMHALSTADTVLL